MEHAWLDSLSEDWPSQSLSDASLPPMPSTKNSIKNGALPSSTKNSATRIPHLGTGMRKATGGPRENSSGILSERSLNDINIPRSLSRSPSKLSQEIKVADRGRHMRRSVSASTAGSVVHNTVNHKSLSASPNKDRGETPEWKRRLIHGGLGYGEQRDLFTSAGTGLEHIFKPLPSQQVAAEENSDDESVPQDSSSMPSSPPPYRQGGSTFDIHIDESVAPDLEGKGPRDQPRQMTYRMNDEGAVDSSVETEPSSQQGSTDQRITLDGETQMSTTSTSQIPQQKVPFRTVSGQSDFHNEDFSPILISRQNAQDGKLSFAPMDLPPDQLRQRLEKLRRNQMVLEDVSGNEAESKPAVSGGKSFTVDCTEDYERLGGFINFRRGGRSADGSFRHRPLSPPLTTDTSEMLPEESLQASTPKQFPTVRIENLEKNNEHLQFDSPPLPAAPRPSPEKKANGSAGSPLKLFGPYDTFTNQTLLRRISQFEEQNSSRTSVHRSTEAGHAFGSGYDKGSAPATHPNKHNTLESSRNFSQFGAGELDGYEFDDGFSQNSGGVPENGDDEDEFSVHNAEEKQHRPPFFQASPSSWARDEEHLNIQRRRQKSITPVLSSRPSSRKHSWSTNHQRSSHSRSPTVDVPEVLETPKKRDSGSESKRPRTSPSKDPTPKRRRTLHKSDIAYGYEVSAVDTVHLSHQQMQSIIGKKRKDARNGDHQQIADADVLSERQILRPRTPTPSQRSSVQREQPPQLVDGIGWEETTQAASLTQKTTLHIQSAVGEVNRKPSIKTEDFINEANKIMAMIRGKGGLQSGLASLEESENENVGSQEQPGNDEDSFQESTKEPFSRPPSREGRPVPRLSARQEDPELANRLKKYEERSDMGDIITSSVRSLGLAQEAIQAAKNVEQQIQQSMDDRSGRLNLEDAVDVSDPPNIRITTNPFRYEETKGQGPDASSGDRFSSRVSNSSSDNSTGRSIPTGSSRGSDTRKTIAPQSVSHLIPDQVGNMVLDRSHNIWIKRKANSPKRTRRSSILPSEGSEDDPFADIPDLSVDVTKEIQNLRGVVGTNYHALPREEDELPSSSPTRSSPVHMNKPSAVANSSVGVTNALQTEVPMQGPPMRSPSKMMKDFAETDDEEVEHEIRLHEDRITTASPKRRNLTISFSSPIASIIQDAVAGGMADDGDEPSRLENSLEDMAQASDLRGGRRVSHQSSETKASSRSRSNSRGGSKFRSVRGQGFIPRPVSRIDEQDEDSVVASAAARSRELSVIGETSVVDRVSSDQRQTSLSFVVATPARPVAHPQPENAQILGQYVGTLSLSPLSEFTAHHDQTYGLEVSYVLGDDNLVTGDGSKRVMSLTVRNLVDKLAEVEPFEPYWEDMESLEIRDKNLSSLHMLDEFCGGLVALDASNNTIRNLDGVPKSVRELKITHNILSELTSWGHLLNLQYVDVSNNGVKSLTAFKSLVHLRKLNADNNNLTSLDGIMYHDGLQSLRARGNLIEALDFDGTKLQRLTELDLEGNQIKKVDNLHQLSCLVNLKLKGNQIEEFGLQTEEPMHSLKYLDLSSNMLDTLDIQLMPSLRLLHLDRNRLTKLVGCSKVRRLDSLSLREQHGTQALDLSFLGSAYEIRKLFLSGNHLEAFVPPVDFLNLQLLDLANCGLQSLPDELGQMMPNLRVVNLNFNALSDIACLRYIPRMKKLLLAGNRIAKSSSTVDVLSQFPYVTELDLRDNPVTQGFYAPLQVLVHPGSSEAVDPFKLPDADPERDATYFKRLDMDTRMRRRLYDSVFVEACKRLRKLDGLPLNRDIASLRDSVWKALAFQGVLVEKDGSRIEIGDSEACQEIQDESRWEAEDSFA